MRDTRVDNQTELTVSEHEELFEKDFRAVVRAVLPDAVSWDELLEEICQGPELKKFKSAIARGYFTAPEKKTLGPQYNPVFTELAGVGGLGYEGFA